jgi:hypothetical protein
MHVIFVAFEAVLMIIGLVCGILDFIAIPVVGGYFFCRFVLKVMGLHSGFPEQVRNELKLAAVFAVFMAIQFVLMLLGCFFGDGI